MKDVLGILNPTDNKSGSTLWTSSSEKWTKLSLENVDVESVLKKSLPELKQQSPELKKRIALFETPVHPEFWLCSFAAFLIIYLVFRKGQDG